MSGTPSEVEYTCHMPNPGTPMVNMETGAPSIAWWTWALRIFARTGNSIGTSTDTAIDKAEAAQATADAAVVDAAAAQTTANTGVANAATAQTAANTANASVATETAARIAADALLLPLAGGTLTGPLTAPQLRTTVFTVATLPAGVTGSRAAVNNALGPAFGAAVVGGGAVTIPVFFNGAVWVVG